MLNSTTYSGDSHRGPAAVALFEVSRTPPGLTDTESEPDSEAAWQALCKTQLAKLRSYYVLQAAVRESEIASLPLLREHPDPVSWLANSLEVRFHPGSELMYVRLYGKPGQEEQLKKIVNEVAKAYEEEVLYARTQDRLGKRDLLAQTLNKLRNELTDKTEVYNQLAHEAGASDTESGRIAQELDMRRLDRIENEIMRLENANLEEQTRDSKASNAKFYELRLEQLNKQQAEIEQRILERSRSSADLTGRRRELDQMQRVYDELSIKLNFLDVELNAPPRIRKVQSAVVISN
jgi:hypothetical protein